MKLYANVLGKGKPFIILHGFLGMSDNWKTLGKRFTDEGFEVHLVDQRNHGRSPHTEEFSYELMAQDIQEYCDKNNLKDIILLGHSMGGKTAMKTACEYPDLVEKLIIADIAPKYYAPHHQTILEGLTMLSNSELTSRGEADEKLEEYIKEWGVRQFLLKNLYWKEKGKLALRMNLEVLKEKVNEIGQALTSQDVYEGKTLFLNGGKSNYIKKEDKSLIKEHFPAAVLVTIKDAGHWLHAEKAGEFYQSVVKFIENV
ncbi:MULTISPECIES: alpha/beta fold hydrolase [Mesonia]|uniref:Esterase YbfF n=1 Tax=Mesonia oceanica TaxID=2687242 RepID=A0AC61Y8D9_9FLAO|nr:MULTISPECIES: alpha/beta fold hydrolase [Mesonia]MAN27388.1 alpha/beta hydrolase [Mesonia sp.]MAQ40337.1 alpha/beta hydrolase [Mesonia sp.]MBJ97248.1 alpha/beta hydrolase [Flavobacteriaceae bacterium]VVV00769.1 Esterase YbfF [Mesonia oceanica]|tara:strand:- start:68 stop:838 length:771 start_codon:yes stop_codon:yes gene_type:complete